MLVTVSANTVTKGVSRVGKTAEIKMYFRLFISAGFFVCSKGYNLFKGCLLRVCMKNCFFILGCPMGVRSFFCCVFVSAWTPA